MKYQTKNLTSAVIFLTILFLVSPASAEMYAINAAGELRVVDTTNASTVIVGNLPNSGGPGCCTGYNEIGYNETNSTAWAQERDGNFRAQQFSLVDASGIGAPVANGASMHGYEFVDGSLVVAGFAGSITNGLGRLDPSIGVSSLVVFRDDWSSDTQGEVMTGLACSGPTMYGITNGSSGQSSLYTISSTGVLSLVGLTGIRAGSLEFGNDGVLYAGGVAANAGLLYRVNNTTGVASLVGDTGMSTGGGISGLMRVGAGPDACTWGGVAPIPALSDWLLILMAGLLSLLGIRQLHSKTE